MRKMVRWLAVAVVLTVTGFGAAAPAAAADPVVDVRAFVAAGFHGTTDDDYRAWAGVLASVPDGPSTRQQATAALAGTIEELRAYVDGGYLNAWFADERLRVTRVLAAATGPAVEAGAQAALASSDRQDLSDFLTNGLPVAQYADDRLMASTMLTGGVNNSGPALDAAAQAALAGTPAELREFLLVGQFVARAIDAAAAPVVPAVPVVPAAPVAPAAQPAAAAPQAVAAAAPTRVLAVTGPSSRVSTAGLAAVVLLVGVGLVVLARRRDVA
ncbi:hypothetical protein CTKZ_35740 [Cellulomonas algicola]|uniref:Gram-positive cocci surface proteins LPxTG domain-containing protein n=2 Tax=Cellulomonas algicola TaxID=2071633 RepID=A0A401V533_9CELL|nr:hypothetical protein CTKZ_35740 [Cellulomonas algicola]